MRLCTFLLSSAAVILLFSSARAASFEDVGDLPGGVTSTQGLAISSDGSTVVGRSRSAGGWEAFYWTSGGGMMPMGDLPGGTFDSRAYGVSTNGSVIVGESNSASGTQAYRWTAGTGMVSLGVFAVNGVTSSANAVSADGSVVVGRGTRPLYSEAFIWTSGGGMVGLGHFAGGTYYSSANAVSADGTIVVGQSTSSPTVYEAFRWTAGTGMVRIGDLAGGTISSNANDISGDGNVIVGQSSSGNGAEAFRWNAVDGMVGLGDLAGGSFNSTAFATNSDGSVIVGAGENAIGTTAFVWKQATGMQSLEDILTAAGVDLTGYRLTGGRDVDGSGNIITGYGTYGGNSIGFIANILTGGVTTPVDLAEGLASGVVPVQQVRGAVNYNLSQSLFAATQTASLFQHDGLNIFNENDVPADIAPAAGNSREKRWSAYMVGSFGIAQHNDIDNRAWSGTTGLMAQVTDGWIIGLGVIGHHSKSDMAYNGDSSLNGMGGAFVTSYESDGGLRLYGSVLAAHLNVNTERQYLNGAAIDTSHGKTTGMGYGIAARGGWEFHLSDIGIMPYAEIQASKTELDSYTETGGAFPATYSDMDGYEATSKLGAQFDYDVTPTLNISTRLAWAHPLYKDNKALSVNALGFSGTLADSAGDKNWGEMTLGLGWQVTPDTHLSTEITARAGRTDTAAGTVTLGLSTRF